jgi:anti-sigma B factor antagonist
MQFSAGRPVQAPSGNITTWKFQTAEEPVHWQLSIREIEDITIVDILETSIAPSDAGRDLRAAVNEVLEKGGAKIIVDLTRVNYIDSAGIGDLVGSFSGAQNQSARLKLLRPQPHVHKLLAITGLTTVFEIHQDEKEAIESFRS